ncbi:MAG TPA: bifunctional glutamate N-acetyltransferase/amino-acid acetyltransferase ArgJ [Gemmataceae bacterium]|jgi:glutamate N-acetyltransferase/amino-acid N-acetyltransferase|nr:bifunctional glutamate N-acetyltransferase/amino-acid acetyltransferase ArgJ [Gemmataceae bacterium]
MTNWHLARGFRFAGLHCGLRPDPNRLDLALAVSDGPAVAAGVFTQNRVRAAPVRVCQERLPSAAARAVVVCSGNANACTGARGLADARRMTALAAEGIGCAAEDVLVCSTGVIGRHLPMPQIEDGVRRAPGRLAASAAALDDFAHAILTTDTRIKVATQEVNAGGLDVRLTGVAKGAAMIGPNMATMLAFVFSDAPAAPDDLRAIAARAAEATFNCVRVEGHTSTNDSLLLFANGQAGAGPLRGDGLARFEAAVRDVCAELARAIAADAEGATHLVTIEVEGLRDDGEARRVARAVADSPLVKTAIHGADPNWGRVVSAAGYAGVAFEEEHLSLWLGDLLLYHAGTPQPFDAATASAYLKRERNVTLRLRFTLGAGRCTFWTCDLTPEYVRLNADYTT